MKIKARRKKAKGLSSLSGGGQVDGLPPAASNTDPSLKETRIKTELFEKFQKFFFEKIEFLTISPPIWLFFFSGV